LKNLIWYEKFRPDSLSSMTLPLKAKKIFREYIREKQIPHVLFYGPPGSGKTTLAMILLKATASRKLILNASSGDRGIATIKIKVKQFATAKRTSSDKLNVVFLDEADGLTFDAQMALKNTVETYHKNCRFIFTCNHIDMVIPEIASRCIPFQFDTYPKDKLLIHLKKMLDKEGIKYKEKSINRIIELCYPDIRSIINLLQKNSIGKKLEDSEVLIDLNLFREFLLDGNLFKIREIFNGKMDFVWVYKYLFNIFIPEFLDKDVKSEAAIITAGYLYKDRTVPDKEINCTACCLELMDLMEVNISFG